MMECQPRVLFPLFLLFFLLFVVVGTVGTFPLNLLQGSNHPRSLDEQIGQCIKSETKTMHELWANHSQVGGFQTCLFNVFTRTLGKISMFDDVFFFLKGI